MEEREAKRLIQAFKMGSEKAIDHQIKYMTPVRIIKSGIATIVFWKNGDKTIVKRSKGTEDDDYSAFCAAFTKHIVGTNSQIRKIMAGVTEVHENKKAVQKDDKKEIVQEAVKKDDKKEIVQEAVKKIVKPAPKKKKPVDKGKAIALFKAGWTQAKIADELGCAQSTVNRTIKEYKEIKS